jgi:hypothetical protein
MAESFRVQALKAELSEQDKYCIRFQDLHSGLREVLLCVNVFIVERSEEIKSALGPTRARVSKRISSRTRKMNALQRWRLHWTSRDISQNGYANSSRV